MKHKQTKGEVDKKHEMGYNVKWSYLFVFSRHKERKSLK